MTYAFSFDASACSGCKACQAACKDKNNLPLGVLWRRIYEVGGGEWTHSGVAWTSTVYAYNLSIACNHCVHPKCAGVCPVDAYTVREDGIVILDSSKCIGCGYCAWACPYGAPQYDRTTGTMTKCNFCFDNLDSGLLPACVVACPMRVLDLGEQSEMEAQGLQFQVVFPMPITSRTEPRVYIKPHPAAERVVQAPQVLNREEYAPQRKRSPAWSALEEIPLLIFTLLGQTAAGISWILGIFVFTGLVFSPSLYLAIGAVLSLGLIVSFLHLGSPKNAWRVFSNLHKSWLSREILAAMLFMASWVINAVTYWLPLSFAIAKPLLAGATGLAGGYFVFSMSEVYRLRMAPAWNTWRTKGSFFLSAVILGVLSVGVGLVFTRTPIKVIDPQLQWVAVVGLFALAMELLLTYSEKGVVFPILCRGRRILTAAGFIGLTLMVILPDQTRTWIVFVVFLVVLLEEIIGRWVFYSSRNPIM